MRLPSTLALACLILAATPLVAFTQVTTTSTASGSLVRRICPEFAQPRSGGSDPTCDLPGRLSESAKGATAPFETQLSKLVTLVDNGQEPGSAPTKASAHELTGADFVRFVWLDATGDTPVARQVIFDVKRSRIVTELPGVTVKGASAGHARARLLDVHVLRGSSEKETLTTTYRSDRKQNPIISQVAGVIEQINPIRALAWASTLERKTERLSTAFQIYRPELPLARATITVTDKISVPRTLADVKAEVPDVAKATQQSVGWTSTCAKATIEAYAATVNKASPNAMIENLLSALTEARAPFSACKDLAEVDKAFGGLVTSLGPVTGKGEATIQNVPREPVSFGLLTGLAVGGFSGDPRVKLDAGLVVADPLPRTLTAALVNWHPFGLDTARQWRAAHACSLSIFGGTTLTPTFGLTGGVGFSPLKGLTVNVGRALLFIDTLKGFTPDQTPEKGTLPVHGHAQTWYWGLSYAFP